MPFLYLLLAHLSADFLFQPRELVHWKYHSLKGVAIHSVIHFMAYLLVFFAYLPDWRVFLTMATVAASHFVIDSYKIKKELEEGQYLRMFCADQGLHVLMLVTGAYAISDNQIKADIGGFFAHLYLNPAVVFGLILVIVTTYVVEIVKYQTVREKNPGARFKPDRHGMIKRLAVAGVIYSLVLIFGLAKVAAVGM